MILAKRKKQPTNSDLVAKAGEAWQLSEKLREALQTASRNEDLDKLVKAVKALTDALKVME